MTTDALTALDIVLARLDGLTMPERKQFARALLGWSQSITTNTREGHRAYLEYWLVKAKVGEKVT